MDEVGIDLPKHYNKVIARQKCSHLFHLMAQGDRKMNRQTTLAVTSRSDGK